MKIFDCTTFFDEKMMLDVRFNILDKYVDKFIVVEANFSHSGKKKSLNFEINDYPKFKDKIKYITIEEEPLNLFKSEKSLNPTQKRLNSIKRIEQSYDHMMKGLNDTDENDLVMISDNDEIPNLESLNLNEIKNNFVIFKQLFFYYKFDLLYDKMVWYGTKACKRKNLKSFSNLKNLKNKKYSFWRIDTFFSELKKTNLKIIEDGGWHFTNLKKPIDIFEKFKNFGHHDEFELSGLTVQMIKDKIDRKEVFFDHFVDKSSSSKWNSTYKLKKINDNLLPMYLNQNRDSYKEWFDK